MTRFPRMALAAMAAALVALLAACSDFSINAEAINPSSGGSTGGSKTLSWTPGTLPSGPTYYSVTYANGRFIAVGDGTTAAASTDGINWTALNTIPSYTFSNCWYASSYGNGVLALVNRYSADALTSADGGNSWTKRTLPGTGYKSLTYGNGRFVALGDGANAAYSTDGSTWYASTLPSSQDWRSVVASDSLFVAVSSGGATAAYSADGATWTASTLPGTKDWASVTYGNGIFVAVSYGADAVAISNDGMTWTASTLPSSKNWTKVSYGDGTFLTVAYLSGNAATSTDGKTWTAITLPDTSYLWTSLTYGNRTFVAVAYSNAVAGSH